MIRVNLKYSYNKNIGFYGFKGKYTQNHQPNMEGKATKSAKCPSTFRGVQGVHTTIHYLQDCPTDL